MPNDDHAGGAAWTVLRTLQWTAGYFEQHHLDTPRIDAEVLLAHALRCERIDLYLHHDQPLNENELTNFKQLIRRRLKNEPVAYIVGYKEFWSLRFNVAPGVLIPRPDTECLVEAALALLPVPEGGARADVLELGVGSGAVIVALAKERPDGRYWATDISWRAASVARRNAVHNGVGDNIRFFLSDWFAALSPDRLQFDLVATNPPYIPSDEIAALAPDIKGFEPSGALDGGPDGLKDIVAIMAQAGKYLKPGGYLLIEIGHDQRETVQDLAVCYDAYEQPVFHTDYGGHTRVIQLRKSPITE